MGFYREHVLPRLVDRACRAPDLAAWRAGVTEGLRGRIVELGFGSGLNVAHYPPAVEQVVAVEPSAVALRIAQPRIEAAHIVVEQAKLEELADGSCDCALSSFTLCTIPDVEHALAELRRVVKPGGSFHFLEHGLAPERRVARWQRRLDPLQVRTAGGCHLTRDIPALVAAAGFAIERLEQGYAKGPRPWAWFSSGVARNPTGPKGP